MFTKERVDGTYIRNLNFFTQITPYIKPARTDSVIVFEQEYDVSKTMEFVNEKNVTFNHVFLYAALRTITTMPKLNRFVSGLRYYQRNRVAFSFGNSTFNKFTVNQTNAEVTMLFSPLLTFENFCYKISKEADIEPPKNTKIDKVLFVIQKLPRFLIRFLIWGIKFLDYHNALPKIFINTLPYFSSVIFTDTSSMDIDATYFHNFDIGTCGIFCTIGKINDNKKVKITVTLDNRIAEPAYCVQALSILRDLTENPEKLEVPPEWTTEQFVRLGLTEKELNNI